MKPFDTTMQQSDAKKKKSSGPIHELHSFKINKKNSSVQVGGTHERISSKYILFSYTTLKINSLGNFPQKIKQ